MWEIESVFLACVSVCVKFSRSDLFVVSGLKVVVKRSVLFDKLQIIESLP